MSRVPARRWFGALALTAVVLAGCDAQSPAYKRGFSDGQGCTSEGLPSGACAGLCEPAATADRLTGEEARDYIAGCEDGAYS